MKFRSRSAAALAVLAAWMLSGCEVDKQTQPWPEPTVNDVGLADIPLKTGYYKGRVYEYWEAGNASPVASHVYVLYRQGSRSPIPSTEQYPIVDAVEGEANYSPFRHVVNVTVPASYVGNSLTSVSDLQNSLYLVQAVPTFLAWDAPSVLEEATLGGSSATPTPVWFDGQVSYVFKLEEGIRVDRNSGQVSVATFYEISRGGEVLANNTIFALQPGEPGYSALGAETVVNVTDAYPVGGTPPWQSSIAVDLDIGGYLIDTIETGTIHNHPRKATGAYSLGDVDLGFVDDSDPELYPSGAVAERISWYNGARHMYSDLGRTQELASDVWLLYRVGHASPIEGQDPIVASVPGDSAYSAIRRIHRVYLDGQAAYTPNSIKSYETLLQTGVLDEALDEGWHAPVMNRDARWDGEAPRLGWANARRFAFFLLEEDVVIVNARVRSMSSYEIYRQQSFGDTAGVWLDFNGLIPAVPGGEGYSSVRNVTRLLVNPTYPDTLWRSFADAANNAGRYSVSSRNESFLANRPVRP